MAVLGASCLLFNSRNSSSALAMPAMDQYSQKFAQPPIITRIMAAVITSVILALRRRAIKKERGKGARSVRPIQNFYICFVLMLVWTRLLSSRCAYLRLTLGRAIESGTDIAQIMPRIVAPAIMFILSFHPTSGVRGPDTLWRVPWTPLLGLVFSCHLKSRIQTTENNSSDDAVNRNKYICDRVRASDANVF